MIRKILLRDAELAELTSSSKDIERRSRDLQQMRQLWHMRATSLTSVSIEV